MHSSSIYISFFHSMFRSCSFHSIFFRFFIQIVLILNCVCSFVHRYRSCSQSLVIKQKELYRSNDNFVVDCFSFGCGEGKNCLYVVHLFGSLVLCSGISFRCFSSSSFLLDFMSCVNLILHYIPSPDA